MYSLPFFHLSGENSILKNILDESRHEIYIVHAETLEIIFLNKTAVSNLGSKLTGPPFNVSRLGDDYQLRSFKGLVLPLMNDGQNEIILLTHHQNDEGRHYPVEVRIKRNTIQGLDYFILTAENITERQNLERELKQKNEALKKLNFELDKFVYSASHDLLAPISTLKGLLNLCETESQAVIENSQPDYHGMMTKTVNKLERYIYDMIDFSKNMRQEVGADAVNFKDAMAVVLDNQRFTSGFEKLTITTEIIQDTVFYSDENRLLMVLNNLVSNAVKYQQPKASHPALFISIVADEKKVTINLKDNGIGISKESIDRIFDMFYRASASSYGSGLGLYIVKEVVKKLKGKVHVASVVGEGSEFLLEIPNNVERNSVHKKVKKSKPLKTAL